MGAVLSCFDDPPEEPYADLDALIMQYTQDLYKKDQNQRKLQEEIQKKNIET